MLFLFVSYPIQQFCRFAAVVFFGSLGVSRVTKKRTFALLFFVVLFFTSFVWGLLLVLGETWAFPVPWFDIWTGPMMIPVIVFVVVVRVISTGDVVPMVSEAFVAPVQNDSEDGGATIDGNVKANDDSKVNNPLVPTLLKLETRGLSRDSKYRWIFCFSDGVTLPVIIIPLSAGLFKATSGFWQLGATSLLVVYRIFARWFVRKRSREWLRPSDAPRFILVNNIFLDCLYEFHCSMLFGSYDSAMTMMVPPIMGFLDNIWAMRGVYYETRPIIRDSKIMVIVLREFIELSSSFGALVIYPIVCKVHPQSFYLIDEVAPAASARSSVLQQDIQLERINVLEKENGELMKEKGVLMKETESYETKVSGLEERIAMLEGASKREKVE